MTSKRVLGVPTAGQPNQAVPQRVIVKNDSSNDLPKTMEYTLSASRLSPPQREKTPDVIISDADIIDSVGYSPPKLSSSPHQPKESDRATDSGDYVCPICDEKMVSLSQLNRHLDDEHLLDQSTDPSTQLPPNEELNSWLRKTNEVKSRIQTLPRKFVKLDIFDNNTNFTMSGDVNSRESSSTSVNTIVPEISVTRKHWVKPTGYDTCSQAHCSKQLSLKNGIVNCRRCGELYCNEHTNFRVRLSANAAYDCKGTWCRCCEACFKGKPGYDDFGSYVDLTSKFLTHRQKRIDERELYANKLEKRVINLSYLLSKINKEYNSTEFNSNFLNFKISSKKKEVEQQLVPWEDSSHILNCFVCLRNFTFTLRKHHCRLCGKVVCGDIETGCSMEVPIDLLTVALDVPKVNDSSSIRMCKQCKEVLLLKRNFERDTKVPLSPLLQKFETQQNIKSAIAILMPRFHDMIQRLKSRSHTKSVISDASKLRRRLLDSFGMFERLTKEIVRLECQLNDERALQLAIQTDSANFIQQNMAPLKQLPKLLDELEKQPKRNSPTLKFSKDQVAQIKQNREMLMVLQEQKYLVHEMIENCKKQRQFDELTALVENLKEIDKNIVSLQSDLGEEGF